MKLNTYIKITAFMISLFLLLKWLVSYDELKPSENRESLAGFKLALDGNNGANEGKTRIPKIIHQTWSSQYIPEQMRPWVQSWVKNHQDWEYWFWTDDDIRKLVELRYPAYLKLFDSYPTQGYRADAFRYFVLFEFGGVYADLDTESVHSLNSFISKYDCFLSQEPYEHAHFLSPMGIPLVSNAIMGCRRGHPFFAHVIGDLHRYAGWFSWNDILRATGPFMLTEIYKGYIKSENELDGHTITLADPDVFHPTTDSSMRDHMREACVHSKGHEFLSSYYFKWQEKLCTKILQDGFHEKPLDISYTDHHWTHTWAGRWADPWNLMQDPRTYDIKKLKQLS